MKTMNKIYSLSLVICLLFCTSCEKEMITYSGDSAVYFPIVSQTMGTIDFSCAEYHSDTLSVVYHFDIKTLGEVKEYDRTVAFEAVENDTLPARAGVDYEVLTPRPVIPKGEVSTSVSVRFFRTRELLEQSKVIEFRLSENEDFDLRIPLYYDVSYTSLIFVLSEKIYEPWWWRSYGKDRFGRWTKTKGNLICDKLNIPRADWNDMSGKVDEAFLTFACIWMYDYLEKEKKAGRPVYDEPLKEGEESPLMEMGPMANPQ